ncbi:MAG: hypothetical protein WC707_05490 [Candidatus Babeliaceae bacterium]
MKKIIIMLVFLMGARVCATSVVKVCKSLDKQECMMCCSQTVSASDEMGRRKCLERCGYINEPFTTADVNI